MLAEFVLELENIGKTFCGVNVLRGINLRLKKEVHVLLGENGAEKIHADQIISGYHTPDEGGVIRIGSGVQAPQKCHRCFHPHNLSGIDAVPDMTVAENIDVDKQKQFAST